MVYKKCFAKSILLFLAVSSGTYSTGLHGAELELGGPPAVIQNKIVEGPILEGATPVPNAPSLSSSHVLSVRMDVTHTVEQIADGVKMVLWGFGGKVPGPTIRVRQGDKVNFTMANRSMETIKLAPPMPHSIDFHAAQVSPQDKYRSVMPGQTISFGFVPNYPGVFMYHCGTPMILEHLSQGMYGAMIVEPKGGYPSKVDREYVLIQSEFYPTKKTKKGIAQLDREALLHRAPEIVAFNGRAMRHMQEPLLAKPGERVRLFILNAGPNLTSSFHIVGIIFDRVWLDGSPANELKGMQTVLLGASSSAIVEFVIPEKGKYVMVDHSFVDANSGAMGVIDASGE